jgi:hypothetical protein
MPKLAGTKRSMYTSQRVKEMRSERLNVKAKKEGVSDEQVQKYLGKLQAAGHMRVNGFRKLSIDTEELGIDTSALGILSDRGYKKNMSVTFQLYNERGMNDKPHFDGYLRSASEVDKQYKLKGWFNEDGTIRIELVN